MSPQSAPRVNILLVEDDDAYARLIEAWLGVRGGQLQVELHRVATLGAAQQSLRGTHSFTGVALDLYLPDTPPEDATHGLRTLLAMTGCPPIVAITAYSRDLGAAASAEGAADFIVKSSGPEGLETLLNTIHQASIRQELSEERDELLVSLRAHNIRLQRLTKVMAHDIVTPIAVALSSVETAATLLGLGQHSGGALQLEIAKQRLKELAEQLSAILDETISGAGGTLSVDILETAELAYASLAREERLRLQLITGDPARVRVLPGTLRSVLQNLLSNAVKHNPGRVTVWIHTEVQRNRVELVVEDDGAGWPADPAALDIDGVSTAGSTGLGLTTVRHAVESMQGTVAFEHRLGGGARVVLTLPSATDNLTPSSVDSGSLTSQP